MAANSHLLPAYRDGITDPDSSANQLANAAPMKRILLVDDEAHVLRVMKLSLDRNGYEVDTALGGDIALRMMKDSRYDVLITDSSMPHMSGKELCHAVHQQFRSHAPLLFIVESPTDDDSLNWIDLLPNTECLEKPISLRWLVARLNEYFGDYDRKIN